MKRRIVHCLLLAAVLVGLPLLCAWLGGKEEVLADVAAFPPKGEEWLQMADRLWAVRCPFSWRVFLLFLAIVAATTLPLAATCCRALVFARARRTVRRREGRGFPRWGWLALAVMLAGWVLAWTRFGWFAPLQRYPYVLQWGGFIFFMNALCVKRSGRSPLTDDPRHFALLFPTSSFFWWFFEYLNRYVWNWFYLGVEGISAAEYAVLASVCFSSVLPGVVSVAAWLETFDAFQDRRYRDFRKVDVRSKTSIAVLSLLSLYGLVGIVFIPEYAFPFLWISPLMVFVLVQILLKEESVLDRLKWGDWGFVFRNAVAALVCGLVWETWNWLSYAKWVYNVPWVSRFYVWEMPILGFAGYLPFGLECAAVAHWLKRGSARESGSQGLQIQRGILI